MLEQAHRQQPPPTGRGLPRMLASKQPHLGRCAGPYLPARLCSHEGPPPTPAWQCRVPPTSSAPAGETQSAACPPRLSPRVSAEASWAPESSDSGPFPARNRVGRHSEPESGPSWEHAGADNSHAEDWMARGSRRHRTGRHLESPSRALPGSGRQAFPKAPRGPGQVSDRKLRAGVRGC